jgi:ADP-ribose pyrophosphatase YjhB (NUDIX family)
MERLFCVTVFVFNKEGDHCLFMNHKKLGKWMPPGGKVDPNELPDDAAIRECLEETGVKVSLVGERATVEGGLMRPYGMQLNVVKPGVREHIDFIYLAVADSNEQPTLNAVESTGVTWIPAKVVLEQDFNTFDSVKTWVQQFMQELSAIKTVSTDIF